MADIMILMRPDERSKAEQKIIEDILSAPKETWSEREKKIIQSIVDQGDIYPVRITEGAGIIHFTLPDDNGDITLSLPNGFPLDFNQVVARKFCQFIEDLF